MTASENSHHNCSRQSYLTEDPRSEEPWKILTREDFTRSLVVNKLALKFQKRTSNLKVGLPRERRNKNDKTRK